MCRPVTRTASARLREGKKTTLIQRAARLDTFQHVSATATQTPPPARHPRSLSRSHAPVSRGLVFQDVSPDNHFSQRRRMDRDGQTDKQADRHVRLKPCLYTPHHSIFLQRLNLTDHMPDAVSVQKCIDTCFVRVFYVSYAKVMFPISAK